MGDHYGDPISCGNPKSADVYNFFIHTPGTKPMRMDAIILAHVIGIRIPPT
jgi:hypothetical protein